VDIVGWWPGSTTEIVDTRGWQVITIDVYTGAIREFSPKFESTIGPSSVRLLQNGQIAFYAYNPQTERNTDLWLSGFGDQQATAPVFQELGFSPFIAPDGESLILYDRDTLQTRTFGDAPSRQPQQAAQMLTETLATLLQQAVVDEFHPRLSYRITQSPVSRWTAFDRYEEIVLADLATGETQQVTLDTHLRIARLLWSPDGQSLALLVTEGPRPIPYQKLFVLNSITMQLRETETDYHYVTDVTWSPDSQSLLMMVKTGEFEGYGTRELLLANTISNAIEIVPILPANALGAFDWGLSWSPDGGKIAIAYADKPGNYNLYRIDVLKHVSD
jgi:Tol biopolymer transport system component